MSLNSLLSGYLTEMQQLAEGTLLQPAAPTSEAAPQVTFHSYEEAAALAPVCQTDLRTCDFSQQAPSVMASPRFSKGCSCWHLPRNACAWKSSGCLLASI